MLPKKYYILIGVTSIVALLLAYFYYINKNNVIKREIVIDDYDIVFGNHDAMNTIIMFSNYECVHCRNFLKDDFPKLNEEFIQSGKLRFVIKILSFTQDQYLIDAYKTAICLNQFGDFTELNKLLINELNAVYTKDFQDLILNYNQRNTFFADCMLSGKAQKYLIENLEDYTNNKITVTPSFIINNNIYNGYFNYSKFRRIIKKELYN